MPQHPTYINLYYDRTHMHTKWLAEARGGKVSFFSYFNYVQLQKVAFSSKFEVFVLNYQKLQFITRYGKLKGKKKRNFWVYQKF